MTMVLDRDDAGVDTLVELPKALTALEVFASPDPESKAHPINTILARVRSEIEAFKPDLTTASGRKRIAAIAYRVSQAKSALKKVGDDVAKAQKEVPKRIDATRKHVNDTLDKWRDEVRQPLTEWEAAEEARVNAIKGDLAELESLIGDAVERPAAVMKERLQELQRNIPTAEHFEEYMDVACDLHAKAVTALTARLASAVKREAEAAELEALRREKAERERIEREADEAAERAAREKRIAEQAAQAERDRAAAAAKAAEMAAAERERKLQAEVIAAKKAAEDAAVEAAKRAKAEAEASARAEQSAREARERDKEHKAKVHRDILSTLVKSGIGEISAKAIVTMMAKGQIPHVAINY